MGLAEDAAGNMFTIDGGRGVIDMVAPPLTPNSAPAAVIPCPLNVAGQCALTSGFSALAFGP